MCPSDDELFAFALGQLAAADAERLRPHVVGCEACCAAVAAAARQKEAGEHSLHEELDALKAASGAREELAQLKAGEKLGRYSILEFLGKGAMGAVYQARDAELDRFVAIKVLRSPGGGGELQARLQREAQTMAKLSHPNVVTVHELASVGQQLFVVMELVAGGTVRAWLGERTRSLDEVLDLFIAAGRGLAAAHRAGIVHRDFKPENVLVGSDGRAMVTDFGLARSSRELRESEAGAAGISKSKMYAGSPIAASAHNSGLVGTPAYMAPEQLARGEADARSDLFAYCVSLYEAVHRIRAFPAGDIRELKDRHAEGPQPPPGESIAPPWLQEILLAGMRVDPNQRPQTMELLLDSIEAARLAAIEAARRGMGERGGPGSRRWKFAAAALVAAAAVSIALFAWKQASARAVCRESAARVSRAWDDQRRQEIHDAFFGTHLSYAGDTFERVSLAFERFAKAWPAAFLEACTASLANPDASTEAHVRMSCLSEELAAVQAKSDLFAHADERLVEDAAAMASAIEDPAECAGRLALNAPPPPSSPALRSSVERVRADLAKVHSLGEASHFQEAKKLVAQSIEEAQTLGFRPVQAEALYARAELASEAYDTDALAAATSAALLAEGARHDKIAAQAWTLALHDAAELSLLDQSNQVEGHARAAIERLGGDDALTASLENALGSNLERAGKPEEALAAQRSAWAHYQKTGREDRFSAWLLNDEASALEVLGMHAEAAEEFKRAVDLKIRLLGPGHPDVAISRSNFSSVLISLGRYREAKEQIDAAGAIYRSAFPPGHFFYLVLDTNLGDLQLAEGDPAAALASYQAAIEVAEKNSISAHPVVRDSQLGAGRALLALGRPLEAISSFEKALPPEGSPADAVVVADVRFGLARALDAAGREPERVAKLAGQARAIYLANGARGASSLAALDAWRTHQERASRSRK